MKLLRLVVAVLFVGFLLFGCSPAKRFERLIKHNPELIQRDTTLKTDTLIRERIVTISGEVITPEKEIENEFSFGEHEADFEFVITDEVGKLTTKVNGVKRDGRFYLNVKTNQASEKHYYNHDVALQDTTINNELTITEGYIVKVFNWRLLIYIICGLGVVLILRKLLKT